MRPRGGGPPPTPTPRHPPPATPSYYSTGGGGNNNNKRDSDASFCSSRPSTGNRQHPVPTDPSSKHASIRAINSYLSSHKQPITLPPSLKTLPSNTVIIDIFKFIFGQLEYGSLNNNDNDGNSSKNNSNSNKNSIVNSGKFEEEVAVLLKLLNCPHKINKSALRTPGAPHAFPHVLAILHWLVQLADYANPVNPEDNTQRDAFMEVDSTTANAMEGYVQFMKGDDEAALTTEREFFESMETEIKAYADELEALDVEAGELEKELTDLRNKPSEREELQKVKKDLEGDLAKFQDFITSLQESCPKARENLEMQEKELAVKVQEIRRIKEENEELAKQVKAQAINMRDAERMKRELQAVERDIGEAEGSRTSWEDKCWDLDASIRRKFKELEALSIDCNQTLRRLKLGGNCQYSLNPKGNTPAEVLGINYKTILKPAINSLAEDIEKSKTVKSEECIALKEQFNDLSSKIDVKSRHLNALQSRIDEVEHQCEVIKKDIEAYTSSCNAEIQRISESLNAEENEMQILEKEAIYSKKAYELELDEVRKQSELAVQQCASELLALVDTVSMYKEHMEMKLSETVKTLFESAASLSDTCKSTLSAELSAILEGSAM